jgi:hypothetical protein
MGYKKYKLLIEHFLDAIIKRFKKRLSELGAKKIIPEDGMVLGPETGLETR